MKRHTQDVVEKNVFSGASAAPETPQQGMIPCTPPGDQQSHKAKQYAPAWEL
jgi:hypothetical protein